MALAVGRLLPALTDVSHVAFGLLGAAYGVFGVLLLVLAAYRSRGVRSALAAQEPLPEHGWIAVAGHRLRPGPRRADHRADRRRDLTPGGRPRPAGEGIW